MFMVVQSLFYLCTVVGVFCCFFYFYFFSIDIVRFIFTVKVTCKVALSDGASGWSCTTFLKQKIKTNTVLFQLLIHKILGELWIDSAVGQNWKYVPYTRVPWNCLSNTIPICSLSLLPTLWLLDLLTFLDDTHNPIGDWMLTIISWCYRSEKG